MWNPRFASLVAAALLAPAAVGQPPKPVATFTGHTAPVAALAFSADGTRIVSACRWHVRAWDAATGRQTEQLSNVGEPVVALAADAKTVAVGGREKVALRAAATGKEVLSVEAYADWDRATKYRPAVTAVAFAPDGKRFATAGSMGEKWVAKGVVTVWDAATGKPLHRFEGLPLSASAVTFSRDGKWVAAATIGMGGELPRPGEVHVWNAETGKYRRSFDAKEKPAYGEFVSAADVALTADGALVAVAVSASAAGAPAGLLIDDGAAAVRVWDVASARQVMQVKGHDRGVTRVAFSPDGKRLASSGNDGAVRLWDVGTGKEVGAFPFDGGPVLALAFSPDGKRVAAGGEKDKAGAVRVWLCPGN